MINIEDLSPEDKEEHAQLTKRYLSAIHAVQSGVKYAMEAGASDNTSPKHLRVGVNSAMLENAALVHLLIDKGIITPLEHLRSLVRYAELEKELYEKRLTKHFGTKVTLE